MKKTDEAFMRRAISLAKRAVGRTCPNPLVGAVVVKNGEIIGEGYHKKAGMPHAEVEAINSVRNRDDLKGATIYVNLEPCNHYGRTPPCSKLIQKSGISRVVIAMLDVNSKASGGAQYLRDNNIEVTVGVLEDEARKLNEVFIENIENKKPFFVMKAAMLLNGSIAVKGGVSKWITSEKALKFSHRLRGIYDAVGVGINTVIMDDPLLTCRTGSYKQPKRVIFDANLRIPISSALFSKYQDNIYVVTSRFAEDSKKRVLKAMDINTIECDMKNGEFDPDDLCKQLLSNDICSCVIEGGSRTHGYFIKNRLYNKAYLFYAPKIAGSYGAFNVVGGDAPSNLSDVSTIKDIDCRKIGEDIMIKGYF